MLLLVLHYTDTIKTLSETLTLNYLIVTARIGLKVNEYWFQFMRTQKIIKLGFRKSNDFGAVRKCGLEPAHMFGTMPGTRALSRVGL